jgi:hypothetical protein
MIIIEWGKEGVKNLTKRNVVVVWGGTKDIGRNEVTSALRPLKEFVRENNHTTIIQMCILYWFDLRSLSENEIKLSF